MSNLPLRARLATTIGGAAGLASRLAGRGDGSVIGGVIALRLEPGLLGMLAAGRQVVLVTGTNGKTTTTRLVTAALESLGQQVASNAFGANMEAGLTAALGRAPSAPFAVLEVDEKYLPSVLTATAARQWPCSISAATRWTARRRSGWSPGGGGTRSPMRLTAE
jgi:lipid II isoglutaminyl synthase (glutamine-hydrolysing)